MDSVRLFFVGFGYIIEGAKLIRAEKRLWLWAFLPFVLNILIFMLGIYVGFGFSEFLLARAFGFVSLDSSSWYFSLIYYPIIVLFWIVFLSILSLFIFLVASFIASPFNSLLAEKSLVVLKVIENPRRSLVGELKFAIKMFMISLVRMSLLLIIGVGLFFASFIPGLNLFTTFASFMIIASDSIDYSMEAMGMGLTDRFVYLKKILVPWLGMSCFVGLTLLVPGLILVLMPAAVAGSSCAIKSSQLFLRETL